MIDLTLNEKIYVFENRIQLLLKLQQACVAEPNLPKIYGIDDFPPFNPDNPQQRLERGIQDPRPVEILIAEANSLWEGIKQKFIEGISAENED